MAVATKTFEIQMPVVVLANMQGGEIQEWERLDEVWALVGDPPAFSQFIESEIHAMLDRQEPQPSGDAEEPAPPIIPSETEGSIDVVVPVEEAMLPIPDDGLPLPLP